MLSRRDKQLFLFPDHPLLDTYFGRYFEGHKRDGAAALYICKATLWQQWRADTNFDNLCVIVVEVDLYLRRLFTF